MLGKLRFFPVASCWVLWNEESTAFSALGNFMSRLPMKPITEYGFGKCNDNKNNHSDSFLGAVRRQDSIMVVCQTKKCGWVPEEWGPNPLTPQTSKCKVTEQFPPWQSPQKTAWQPTTFPVPHDGFPTVCFHKQPEESFFCAAIATLTSFILRVAPNCLLNQLESNWSQVSNVHVPNRLSPISVFSPWPENQGQKSEHCSLPTPSPQEKLDCA